MPVSYDLLESQVRELLAGETDFIANAANFAAFLYCELPDVNWAGFYLLAPSGELYSGHLPGSRRARGSRARGACAAPPSHVAKP